MNQHPPYPGQQGGRFFEVGGGMHRGGGDSLDWVIFALLLLLILLVVAQLVLTSMRRGRTFGGPPHLRPRGMHGPPGGRQWGRPDALEVARMRYASGEIGRDEYVQLAQDLGGEPEPPPAPPV